MTEAGYPEKWNDALDEIFYGANRNASSPYTRAVSVTAPFVEFLKKYENKDFKMKVPVPENDRVYDIPAHAVNLNFIRDLNRISKDPDIINNMSPEEVQNLQKFRSQLAYICNMFMRLRDAFLETGKILENDQDQ